MNNINLPTIRILLTPILVIIFTILLLFLALTNLLPQVRERLNSIRETQRAITLLNEKIEVLNTFKGDVVSDRTDITYLALPDKNPAPVVISQLKRVLVAQDITQPLKINLAGGQTTVAGINQTGILIEFAGSDLNQILNSFKSFLQIAPLVAIESFTVNSASASPRAEVSLLIYWADLPVKLPEASQPISSLSTEERQVLDKIMTFNLPEFNVGSPTVPSLDRVNPFN